MIAFAIPAIAISSILTKLNVTMIGGKVDYWHIKIIEPAPGLYALAVPNSQSFTLDQYRVPLA